MPVLVGQKRGKKIDVSTSKQGLIYSLEKEFYVYDDSGSANEGQILLTNGIPLVNTIETDAGVPAIMVCRKKSAEQWESNKRYWTVSCSFDNNPSSDQQDTGGNETDNQDPTTWYAIVNFDFQSFESAMVFMQNFAKRPYATPIMEEQLIPTLVFTQYMPPSLSIYDLITSYHDVVNDSQFLNAPGGYWLLTIEDASFGITNGYRCWKVDFRLSFKISPWGSTLGNVYDSAGNLLTSDNFIQIPGLNGVSLPCFPGWYTYVPQVDTIDINKTPFTDAVKNRGDFGKLQADGTFNPNQDENVIYKQHSNRYHQDFSFIRIRNIQ